MSAEIIVTVRSGDRGKQRKKRILDAISIGTLTCEASYKARIMNGPKTGRIYERGEQQVSFFVGGHVPGKYVEFTANKGKASNKHQASAPEEAPANDLGGLVASISSKVEGMVGTVTATAPYALDLETGTPGGKIAPRPAGRPAFEDGRKAMLEELNKTP